MVDVWVCRFVPITFVEGDHFSGVAGDAAVGEEVRRVGEDEVDGMVRNFFQEFEAVSFIKADMVFGVVEDGYGESGERVGDGLGHFFERAASTARTRRIDDQWGSTGVKSG